MRYFYFLFFCFFSSNIYSQINVTSANLPEIGDTVIISNSNSSISFGNSGSNQLWDFSNLSPLSPDYLFFIDPSATPYNFLFPLSNLAIKIDSFTYYYLERTINGLSSLGYVDAGIAYTYNQLIFPTPLSYLDTLVNNEIIYQWDTLLSPPIPSSFVTGTPGPYVVDSLKSIYGNIDTFIVDAWGKVNMSNGVFDALRVFERKYEYDNLYYRLTDTITNTSQWVSDPNNSVYFNMSRYVWRTNDSTVKFSLAEVELDSIGNMSGSILYYLGNSFNNFVISPPLVDLDTVVDVTCYGDNDGKIILNVIGINPLYYTWTGPNNFYSNTQNIYNLSGGNYYVTIIDSNGNQTIDTFFVYEPMPINGYIDQNSIDNSLAMNIVSGGTYPYNFLWNTGQTSQYIYPSNNGQYICEVYDYYGCMSTFSYDVNNLPSNLLDLSTNEKKIIKKI